MKQVIYKVITFNATENKREIHPTIFWSVNAAVREASILFNDADIDSVSVYKEIEDEAGGFKTTCRACHFTKLG